MYISAATAAKIVASDWPMRSYMNQMTVPHEPTSGNDHRAISDSLKLDLRLVTISEIEIRRKKRMAVPTNGKYQMTTSRHWSPLTI